MGIENEMLSRLNAKHVNTELIGKDISAEIDFFFDSVMDTVVDYFNDNTKITV